MKTVMDRTILDEEAQYLAVQSGELASKQVVVKTPEQYEQAASVLKMLKAQSKTLEDKRRELVAPFIQGKQALDDFFKKPQRLLQDAIDRINGAMNSFRAEEDRKAREEQARLAAIKAKEAEELAALADIAQEDGDMEAAQALVMQAAKVEAATPVVVPNVPKTEARTRKNWTFEITDANAIPREFLMPDTKKIGEYVRAMKESASIAGVKVFFTETNY